VFTACKHRPKHVEVIEITNKLLLLHLVGCLYYCIRDARSHKHQMQISTVICTFVATQITHIQSSKITEPSGRAVIGVGLRPLAFWNCRFEVRRDQGCLF